jgi:3-hydroxybutyryl-CoA dehydratase
VRVSRVYDDESEGKQMVREVMYADINIGDKASVAKTVSEYDVYTFAGLSGDYNPVHINAEFAKKSIFKERIAHGMLSASLISAVLGTALPGANTVYLAQELQFKAPVKIGDTITAEVEVLEKYDNKKQLLLRTIYTNQAGKIVLDGRATVMKVEA